MRPVEGDLGVHVAQVFAKSVMRSEGETVVGRGVSGLKLGAVRKVMRESVALNLSGRQPFPGRCDQ